MLLLFSYFAILVKDDASCLDHMHLCFMPVGFMIFGQVKQSFSQHCVHDDNINHGPGVAVSTSTEISIDMTLISFVTRQEKSHNHEGVKWRA